MFSEKTKSQICFVYLNKISKYYWSNWSSAEHNQIKSLYQINKTIFKTKQSKSKTKMTSTRQVVHVWVNVNEL